MQSSPSSESPDHPTIRRFFEKLSTLQTARPFAVLLVALLSVIGAGVAASNLRLKTALSELLPENKESVIVAEQVKARLVSSSTLAIIAEGQNPLALKRFVDALAPELRALPHDQIGTVDDGVRESRLFFEKNKALYASLEDVQKAHDAIVSRYEREVQKQAGLDLGLDDDEPASASGDEPLNAETIRAKLTERKDAIASLRDRYPDGYYLEPEGKLIAILVKTPISPGDIERSKALLGTVSALIDKVNPKQFDPEMQVNFTGNLITGMEEYSQIKDDLSHVGAFGVAMILGVVFIFYLRVRTLLAMTVTVGIGTIWSFGLAYFAIGHLNSSTGFLVSIIVGNGINFGIIYMARYMEARRTHDLFTSTLTAHLETWLATLAAAGSAMVAYGSLIITDFRGFKHFGIIGGAGMILCWIATYAFLPAVLAVMDRLISIGPERGIVARLRAGYGKPLAFLAGKFPRVVIGVTVLGTVCAAWLSAQYLKGDPMEYDMRNTRTEAKTGHSTARKLMSRLDKLIGRGQDGLAIVVDKLEQVRPLREALEARWQQAPKDRKPFEKVTDIYDLLPKDQEKKIELITDAMSKLERAKKRGLISEKDWAEIQRELPDLPISPIGIENLPEQAVRMFIEKDGTRGRLVYIVPTIGRSVWDGRYLIEWADSFRETKLKDGSIIRGSGNAVIFADVIQAVVEDAPKAILVSIAGTLLIVLAAFRARRGAFVVIATLFLGLIWMMAALALYGCKITWNGVIPSVELVGLKLNFLNFVALPISVGVGADYAVNMMQRYQLSGRGQVPMVISTTGGAIILCSLTTVLGYFALTFSVNKAIQSFGYSAAAGEVCCLFAAVLALPAFLILAERGQAKTKD